MYVKWRLSNACIGTPHRGSQATLNRLALVGKRPPNMDYRELQITNESWLHTSDQYSIVNFYETVPSRPGTSLMVGGPTLTRGHADTLALSLHSHPCKSTY